MSSSVSARYAALVAAGEIERDPAQKAVVDKLSELQERLANHRLARKSSSLGWMFGRRETRETTRGLYLHGEVGRGKTMLMDLFFESCAVRRKLRVHFHEFMADMHERIHAYRRKLKLGELPGGDPIKLTAADLAAEAWLLCFDEFHVEDLISISPDGKGIYSTDKKITNKSSIECSNSLPLLEKRTEIGVVMGVGFVTEW